MTSITPIAPLFTNPQPVNINGLRPNGFEFHFTRLPNVTYFTQTANIPGISLPAASTETPYSTWPSAGDKLRFSPLEVSFMVSEDMLNYIELYNWLRGAGFPDSREQFEAMTRSEAFRSGGLGRFTGERSDCTLHILSSANNVIRQVIFKDCVITGLSALQFTTTDSGSMEYMTGQATFEYQSYYFDI